MSICLLFSVLKKISNR